MKSVVSPHPHFSVTTYHPHVQTAADRIGATSPNTSGSDQPGQAAGRAPLGEQAGRAPLIV